MNAKNIVSFTGGVMASVLGGIDNVTSIIGLVIALISLGLIVWDLCEKVAKLRKDKKEAEADGVITEEEQKVLDSDKQAVSDTAQEMGECLTEIKDNLPKKE